MNISNWLLVVSAFVAWSMLMVACENETSQPGFNSKQSAIEGGGDNIEEFQKELDRAFPVGTSMNYVIDSYGEPSRKSKRPDGVVELTYRWAGAEMLPYYKEKVVGISFLLEDGRVAVVAPLIWQRG